MVWGPSIQGKPERVLWRAKERIMTLKHRKEKPKELELFSWRKKHKEDCPPLPKRDHRGQFSEDKI